MIRRLFRIVAIAATGAVVALGLFYLLNPTGFRNYVVQPARGVVYFVQELGLPGSLGSIHRHVAMEPETIRLPATDDAAVDVVADIYRPDAAVPPVMILLHGSYPWGRKAGLMRMLGESLSAAGWLVVAPDARGFGESGDPDDPDDPDAWETAGDLNRLIDHLERAESFDRRNLFVLGHSMGANHALEGGLDNPRVRALVLIGPGRFTDRQDELVPLWVRARFSADRLLPEPVSEAVARHAYELGNIRLLADTTLASPVHTPILLIDGAKEGAAKLEYLRSLLARMTGPIEYHTLSNAGHYCGVRGFFGSRTVYYNEDMFDPFLEILLDYLNRERVTTASGELQGEPRASATTG